MIGSKIKIFIVIVGVFRLAKHVFALTDVEISSDLKSLLSADASIYIASDTGFTTNITARFDLYNPPSYIVAVKPVVIEDVQAVIRYAGRNNVPFLTTGGGHGYTSTLGEVRNGLNLDMGNFNTIDLNLESNLLRIGGSVRSAKVASVLQASGKELPISMCSCVGMTGFTLGGGIGPYSGLYGPASDSLASIEMISGQGERLTVSQTKHPELFWGMKGAGFNFGVVTALNYNVYDASNNGQAMNADMIFPGSLNGSVWTIARSFVGMQPKELSITFGVGYDAVLGIVILGNFVYAGPTLVGEQLIRPFLDLQPLNVNISTIAWENIATSALYGATTTGCTPGALYVPYSVNLYQIDVLKMIGFINFLNHSMVETPVLQSAIVSLAMYSSMGFNLRTDATSAFPHRDTIIFAQVDGFVASAADFPAFEAWGTHARSILQDASGRSSRGVYVNFAHGDETSADWYSEKNLRRLRALKSTYDPYSLFGFFNSVNITGNLA